MASYPASAKSFAAVNDGDTVTDELFEEIHDEVEALETALLTGGLAHDLDPDSTANARDLGSSTKKWNDLHLNGEVYERGRSTALGEWTAVAHDSGNFTGNGSMTWTVASGDQSAFAYAVVGKTMTVSFNIVTSTVGGTPSTSLQIAVPGGFTAARSIQNTVRVVDNSTAAIGYASVSASSATIAIQKVDSGNWTASTNATAVQGQITFEIE